MSSPGFSRVRVLYGSESGSESESGPGFAVCRLHESGLSHNLDRTDSVCVVTIGYCIIFLYMNPD